MKKDDLFDLGVEVQAKVLRVEFTHQKTGATVTSPIMHCLKWEEGGRVFFHCLDLDILADGVNEEEACNSLCDLMLSQTDSAIEDHTELVHQASEPYWQKFFDLQRNYLTQAFLDASPLRRDAVKVRDVALTHA